MNSFQIKLIALILMTIDHIGEFLFPQCDLLGYIGRLSAPLFLYILCWSIDYTRNRVRFLARVYVASVIMDIIWILLSIGGIHTDTYNNVFSIFFIVIAVVMILENKTLSKISKICIILAWQAAAWILVFVVMQDIIANAEYETICLIMHWLGIVTYSEGGWFWLILGVIIYYCKNDNKKLIIGYTGVCVFRQVCVALAVFPRILYFLEFHIGGIISTIANAIFYFFYGAEYQMAPVVPHNVYLGDYQWMMIFSLPIMLLYNNRQGRKTKYLFYIYYIVHIVLLCMLSNIM